jgi:hypothetical protein
MKRLASFAVLILAVSCPLFADGNELLKKCAPFVGSVLDGDNLPRDSNLTEKAGDFGFCLGFAQGFTQAHWSIQTTMGKGHSFFCLPKNGVKNGQAIRILVGYMKAHPEKLHLEEVVLATFAFEEAFPCEGTPRK